MKRYLELEGTWHLLVFAAFVASCIVFGGMLSGCQTTSTAEETPAISSAEKLLTSPQTETQTTEEPLSETWMGSFPLTINYSKSLSEMVDEGEYDAVSSGITSENYPLKDGESIRVEFTILHFTAQVGHEDVLAELERRGLRPANIAELLSFGASCPEKQRHCRIVALGSEWIYYEETFGVYYMGGEEDKFQQVEKASVSTSLFPCLLSQGEEGRIVGVVGLSQGMGHDHWDPEFCFLAAKE